MATRNNTPARATDWDALLGQFSDGLSLLAVTAQALAQRQIADDEQVCLAMAARVLNAVYDALDRAMIGMAP